MSPAPTTDRQLLLAAAMQEGRWYRVLYLPGGARVPRVFTAQYLSAEQGGRLLVFNLRPLAGTSTITVDQLRDVVPADAVPKLPRKAHPLEQDGLA